MTTTSMLRRAVAARRGSRVWLCAAIFTAAVLATGCGDDNSPTGPTMQSVSGSYAATTFTTTVLGTTTDQLAQGGFIHLTLAADGTTSGQLFVPNADGAGTEIDESLAGTWSLSGSTVTFSSSSDTFLRDIQLQAQDGQLTGSGTFNGVGINVVLERVTL